MELAGQRKQLRKLENDATKTTQGWESVKAFRLIDRCIIGIAKTDCWKDFYKEIEGTRVSLRVYKIFSKNPAIYISSLERTDGAYTTNFADTVMHLLQALFP